MSSFAPTMNSDGTPTQIAAIVRCRKIKEAKLKAAFGLSKLADDEATIHNANLEEQLHLERLQLTQQTSSDHRALNEAKDLEIAGTRKRQLAALVDKLSGIKELLRFQDEERERDISAKQRHDKRVKRFRLGWRGLRRSRLRKGMNELILAQRRLESTVTQINMTMVKSMKDKQAARLKQKENEILAQQNSMKQQKELENLRELQVCNSKNDFDMSAAEEIEELMAQSRQEEFELNRKQMAEDRAAEDDLEKQKIAISKNMLLESQRVARTQVLRQQKKQEKLTAKANRVAAKGRERAIIMENPIIRGEMESDSLAQDSFSEGMESSLGSRSNSMHDTSSIYDGVSEASGGDVGEVVEETQDTVAGSNAALAIENAQRNKVTDSRVELNRLLESGRERLSVLRQHHQKTLKNLRSHHRSLISQKQREHRRKLADLLKEHEEEIQALKAEHVGSMEELINHQLEKGSVLRDTESSQKLLGMMLPAHVLEDMENGITPQPKSFDMVTIFFTDIPQFKSLASTISSIDLLTFLNTVYARFDSIIQEYPDLYKVENVADTYMVAAGLTNHAGEHSEKEVSAATIAVAECTQKLLKSFQEIDFESFGLTEEVHLRVGGIIGTKMGRYCLFGDTVNTASRMCTTTLEGKIQVSPATYKILQANDAKIEFEERSDVQVKGKGRMTTYLIK
ncbi:adenylate and guanylate cyclase catalytic domain-containing protein [Chytridium lagenaria]|nr:adenylate and guanylate cyclase catalytic domain-containing protein [Chytridium lagenaria]